MTIEKVKQDNGDILLMREYAPGVQQHIGTISDPFQGDNDLRAYYNYFIPSGDKYAKRSKKGKAWLLRNGCPRLDDVKDHLTNQNGVRIAVKAKWYPEFSAIDFDGWKFKEVENVRQSLGLKQKNSFLFESESKDSYHLIFKPRYSEKENPVTIRLLHEAVGPYIAKQGAELYPQKNRVFRLPLGARSSKPIDDGREWLSDWRSKFYWLEKIDSFDVGTLPVQLDLFTEKRISYQEKSPIDSTHYKRGEELIQTGLIMPRSRNEAQFCVLYFYWRWNTIKESAVSMVKKWVRTKHNGMSKDFNSGHLRSIDREIEAQAEIIWNYTALPDMAHNSFFGSLTKDDLETVIKLSGGNLPRLKFMFNLARWYRPRRLRDRVRCHTDNFVKWAGQGSHGYKMRLNELESMGIVERGRGYLTGQMSKEIKLKMPFSDGAPILIDGRSEGLNNTLIETFQPRDLKKLLKTSGMRGDNADRFIRQIT